MVLLAELQRGCDAGESEWSLGVDSTVVRAHQDAAGAPHALPSDVPIERLGVALDGHVSRSALPTGARSNYKERGDPASGPGPDPQREKTKPPDREALGHSRGGLSTKVHLAADQRCRPLAFVTTVGQRHDAVAFELVLSKVAVARHGPGRPRTRPDYALADKAYSSKAIREHLTKRGIKAVIPIKDDQAAARVRKGSRGGRPPVFDNARYRQRNTVERSVNKLRSTRAVATRYDKRDYIYEAPLPSPPSESGCVTPSDPIYGTRPSVRVDRSVVPARD